MYRIIWYGEQSSKRIRILRTVWCFSPRERPVVFPPLLADGLRRVPDPSYRIDTVLKWVETHIHKVLGSRSKVQGKRNPGLIYKIGFIMHACNYIEKREREKSQQDTHCVNGPVASHIARVFFFWCFFFSLALYSYYAVLEANCGAGCGHNDIPPRGDFPFIVIALRPTLRSHPVSGASACRGSFGSSHDSG